MSYKFGRNVLPSERRPVSWYSPPVLLQAGRELVSSVDFLRNSDRRELFDGAFEPIEFAVEDDGTFGFDFIADTGDGGNATFTLAEAALKPALDLPGVGPLPRPELVVFGGDLAYPAASAYDYQYRLLEPYALAQPPMTNADPLAAWTEVLAIPQNHDWFDSTTTFCRYFVGRNGDTEFVGACSRQQRTYFAASLPRRWWILGVDFALKGDLDRKQFQAFCSLWDRHRGGMRIEPDDNIILLYPEPYWTRKLSDAAPVGYPPRYQRLEHLLEAPPGDEGSDRETHGAGARIRLRLAGDLHHYCRHFARQGRYADTTRNSTHLVTCGSGGAFMHTTHGPEVQGKKIIDRSPEPNTEPPSLGRRTRVGLRDKTVSGDTLFAEPLDETICYPAEKDSRILALKGLLVSIIARPNFSRPWPSKLWEKIAQLWDSNMGFALCLGLLYGFNGYVNSIAFSSSFAPDGFKPIRFYDLDMRLFYDWLRAMFYSPFATLVNLVMIAGCVRNAWEGTWHWSCKLISGLMHGLLHAVAVCVIYFVAANWAFEIFPDPMSFVRRGLLTWTLVTILGAIVGALIFGLYFTLVNGLFGQLTNNASGAMALQDYKGFLRFRMTGDHLEGYFLACDKVSKKWALKNGRITAQTPAAWQVRDEFKLPH